MISKKLSILFLAVSWISKSECQTLDNYVTVSSRMAGIDVDNCFCFTNPGAFSTVPEIIHPQSGDLERLVIYLFKDKDKQNVVKMYIPNKEKQALIPDLAFEIGDKLMKVGDDTSVKDLFDVNNGSLVIKHEPEYDERYIHDVAEVPLSWEWWQVPGSVQHQITPNQANAEVLTDPKSIGYENPNGYNNYEIFTLTDDIDGPKTGQKINPENELNHPEKDNDKIWFDNLNDKSMFYHLNRNDNIHNTIFTDNGPKYFPGETMANFPYYNVPNVMPNDGYIENYKNHYKSPKDNKKSMFYPPIVNDPMHKTILTDNRPIYFPEEFLSNNPYNVPSVIKPMPNDGYIIMDPLVENHQVHYETPQDKTMVHKYVPVNENDQIMTPVVPENEESMFYPPIDIDQTHNTILSDNGPIYFPEESLSNIPYNIPSLIKPMPAEEYIQDPVIENNYETLPDNTMFDVTVHETDLIEPVVPETESQPFELPLVDYLEYPLDSDIREIINADIMPNETPNAFKLDQVNEQSGYSNPEYVTHHDSVELVDISDWIQPSDTNADDTTKFLTKNKESEVINSNIHNHYETFDVWFLRQMHRFKSYKAHDSFINFGNIERAIIQILQDNGMFVTIEGVLTDVYGAALDVRNLQLRPILIGNSMTVENILKDNEEELLLPVHLPYLQAILVTSSHPSVILGIIPIGKTIIPPSAINAFSTILKKSVLPYNNKNFHSQKIIKLPNFMKEIKPIGINLSGTKHIPFKEDNKNARRGTLLTVVKKIPLPGHSSETVKVYDSNSHEIALGDQDLTAVMKFLKDFRMSDGQRAEAGIEFGMSSSDDDIAERIIGGNAATSSGTPLSVKGRMKDV